MAGRGRKEGIEGSTSGRIQGLRRKGEPSAGEGREAYRKRGSEEEEEMERTAEGAARMRKWCTAGPEEGRTKKERDERKELGNSSIQTEGNTDGSKKDKGVICYSIYMCVCLAHGVYGVICELLLICMNIFP